MAKVLVCWCEVPEDFDFVVLEADDATHKLLKSFHGKYVNAVNTSEKLSTTINDFFYTPEGKFRYEKISKPVKLDGFDLAIVTGFIL